MYRRNIEVRSRNNCCRGKARSIKGQLKCDGTRAETRFRLSAKRASPFISARASVQSTNGSRGVRISGSNAGYTMFRGSVRSTGYPLHSPVSPFTSPPPCVTVRHHVSTGVHIFCMCDCSFSQHAMRRSRIILPSVATLAVPHFSTLSQGGKKIY
jgi:hypothetical protein